MAGARAALSKRRSPSRRTPEPISDAELELLRHFVRTTLGRDADRLTAVEVGRLQADFRAGTMISAGTPVATSATELKLLRYLFERRGEVVSRDEIFRDVWGYDEPPTSRSIDNYILQLRKKIERDPANPQHLLTVRGAGYKLME